MDEISEIREVVRAELANATALRDVKGLLGSITGDYLSPAAELRTSEGLHRQIEALDRQLDSLYDEWAAVGCSIF